MRIKTLIPLFLFLFMGTAAVYGQSKPVEYATLRVLVFYQNDEIMYKTKGTSLSPLMALPDGQMGLVYDEGKKEMKYVADIYNYMNKFNWQIVSTNIIDYKGEGQNNSTSVLVNTNVYLLIATFVREKQN